MATAILLSTIFLYCFQQQWKSDLSILYSAAGEKLSSVSPQIYEPILDSLWEKNKL